MSVRLRHGWTKPENADRYQLFLATKLLPSFEQLKVYKGAYLFRDNRQTETEFLTLTLFEDLEAVRRFAGEDYQVLVVTQPEQTSKIVHEFLDHLPN